MFTEILEFIRTYLFELITLISVPGVLAIAYKYLFEGRKLAKRISEQVKQDHKEENDKQLVQQAKMVASVQTKSYNDYKRAIAESVENIKNEEERKTMVQKLEATVPYDAGKLTRNLQGELSKKKRADMPATAKRLVKKAVSNVSEILE